MDGFKNILLLRLVGVKMKIINSNFEYTFQRNFFTTTRRGIEPTERARQSPVTSVEFMIRWFIFVMENIYDIVVQHYMYYYNMCVICYTYVAHNIVFQRARIKRCGKITAMSQI